MHKGTRQALIAGLEAIDVKTLRLRGAKQLVEYFIWYFSHIVTNDYGPDSGVTIGYNLHRYVVDAIRRFSAKEGLPEPILRLREQYLLEVQNEQIPLLTEMGPNDVKRVLLVLGIAKIMQKATDQDFVYNRIESYCQAQESALEQAFHDFYREVMGKGMLRIYNAVLYGCSGVFGSTKILVGDMAGTTMVTFTHVGSDRAEPSITFTGELKDELTWGVQSCLTDFATALGMIRDVMSHWPKDEKAQKKLFRPDEKISVG